MRNGIKKYVVAAIIFFSSFAAFGENVPAVGLWEKFPVSDTSLKLVARPQYVFTNVKLTDVTIFTGLNQIGSEISLLCCVVVKNLSPLNMAEVVKKYGMDADFTSHIRSIKGLNFMYAAEPVEKKTQNAYFKTVMQTDVNPEDFSPFSAAVIGVRLIEKDTVKNPFKVGEHSFSLKVKYPKGKNIVNYDFKVNDVVVKFSEAAESQE